MFTKRSIGVIASAIALIIGILSVLILTVVIIQTDSSNSSIKLNEAVLALSTCKERAEFLTVYAQANLERNPVLSRSATELALIYFDYCTDGTSEIVK